MIIEPLSRKEQEKLQLEEIKRMGFIRIIGYDLEVEGVTHCFLLDPDEPMPPKFCPAIGIAIKSPHDQLDRREGRVRATARAVRVAKKLLYNLKSRGSFPLYFSLGTIKTTRYKGTVHEQYFMEIFNLYDVKARAHTGLRSEEQKFLRSVYLKRQQDDLSLLGDVPDND